MKVIKSQQFHKIYDDDVFENARINKLNSSESYLLALIARRSDNEIHACFTTNETLAEYMNLTSNRVSHLLSALFKKGVIKITTYKKAHKFIINGQEYHSHRFISIISHVENKTTYLNQVSDHTHTGNKKAKNLDDVVQFRNNKNKEKSDDVVAFRNTNYIVKKPKNKGLLYLTTNYTNNNNIYIHSTSHTTNYIEKKPTEDKTFTKLFNFELNHLKHNQKIIYKARYATVVVTNWIREGITTVEQAKKVINEYNPPQKRRIINEKMPQWYYEQQQLNNPQQQDDDDLKQVQDDIKQLLDKINRETVQNSILSDVKRE